MCRQVQEPPGYAEQGGWSPGPELSRGFSQTAWIRRWCLSLPGRRGGSLVAGPLLWVSWTGRLPPGTERLSQAAPQGWKAEHPPLCWAVPASQRWHQSQSFPQAPGEKGPPSGGGRSCLLPGGAGLQVRAGAWLEQAPLQAEAGDQLRSQEAAAAGGPAGGGAGGAALLPVEELRSPPAERWQHRCFHRSLGRAGERQTAPGGRVPW